jgi:hypothetical protein
MHRLEHVLVMDTDDMPGRGGYGVVGYSPGVTQAERLFVSENFGISDYLHDRENDRLFFSVFRVPGGRRAFVRRFANGTRRNGTQSRIFVHTLFLEDETDDALHGLPWLLADAKFRLAGQSDVHPLTRDRGVLLSDPDFRALEWSEEESAEPPVRRLNNRMRQVERWLAEAGLSATSAADAVAAVIAAFQSGRKAVLPQSILFEQLTLLAWSMLPMHDRESHAWTQHDSQNTVIPFSIANAVSGATVDVTAGATPVARWIVEMNTTSAETWRELHEKTMRCDLSARGGAIAGWQKWRAALLGVVEKVNAVDPEIERELGKLARTANLDAQEPWVDGVEVLQLLWGNVRRATNAGQPAQKVVERWASLLHRSELDRVIFRVPPPVHWLDATAKEIGAGPLVDFFIRGTHDEPAAVPTRAAVGRWLLDGPRKRGEQVDSGALARLAVSFMGDESGLIEPLLDWLLEDAAGLTVLQNVRQLPGYGNQLLQATLRALRRQHPETAAYVRNVLLPQLEKSAETRARVTDGIADAVALMLRGEPEAFLRFAAGLGDRTAARLTGLVAAWLRDEPERTLPLACAIVSRASDPDAPIVDATVALTFAVARAGQPATVWFRALLRIARKVDEAPDRAAMNRFVAEVAAIRPVDGGGAAAVDPLVNFLNAAARSQTRIGRCVQTLIGMTRPAWTPLLANAVTGVLANTSRTAEWDGIVAALAEDDGSNASAVLRRFWERVDPTEVPNVSVATIEATRNMDGAERDLMLAFWATRLRRLPAGDRCEQFIDALVEAAGGLTRSLRIPLAWRKLELGTATERTLNQLDADLYARDSRGYDAEIVEALQLWTGRGHASQRAATLLALLASPRVLPSVKFVCEGMIAELFAALSAEEWSAVVCLPEEILFARGTSAMLLARQLGASNAADAAQAFESACRMSRRFDVAAGLALGRRDRVPWRRLQRALGFGGGTR